ncbi:15722_t:CDS:2 [Gigaspora margarita]|uniref:15722_t:CDS:1 n=1 Tax=Gigaspora margarita TaxID=4874 RepID=A0ABM8W3X5_GIGMA|nr:15722_t:CDS:2 [Gigaspora margarita]
MKVEPDIQSFIKTVYFNIEQKNLNPIKFMTTIPPRASYQLAQLTFSTNAVPLETTNCLAGYDMDLAIQYMLQQELGYFHEV